MAVDENFAFCMEMIVFRGRLGIQGHLCGDVGKCRVPDRKASDRSPKTDSKKPEGLLGNILIVLCQ